MHSPFDLKDIELAHPAVNTQKNKVFIPFILSTFTNA